MQAGWRIKDFEFKVETREFGLRLFGLLDEIQFQQRRQKDLLFLMAGASARGGNVENLLDKVNDYFEDICDLAVKSFLCRYALDNKADIEEVPEF